jgi:hypothetical protein
MVVTFTARVAEDVLPDAVIVNTASASAANVSRVTASASLVKPPLELPRTGADEGCGRGVR